MTPERREKTRWTLQWPLCTVLRGFQHAAKAEIIYYEDMSITKNVKGSPSGRTVISDGNMDLKRGLKGTRNCKYSRIESRFQSVHLNRDILINKEGKNDINNSFVKLPDCIVPKWPQDPSQTDCLQSLLRLSTSTWKNKIKSNEVFELRYSLLFSCVLHL